METPEDRLPSVFVIPLMHFFVGVCLFISLPIGQRSLIIPALIVLGLTIGASLWSRLSLSGIKCTSMVDKHRLFPGESFDLDISAQNWVDTQDRPLGIDFDAKGNLIVADAFRGLISISPEGSISVLRPRLTV